MLRTRTPYPPASREKRVELVRTAYTLVDIRAPRAIRWRITGENDPSVQVTAKTGQLQGRH